MQRFASREKVAFLSIKTEVTIGKALTEPPSFHSRNKAEYQIYLATLAYSALNRACCSLWFTTGAG